MRYIISDIHGCFDEYIELLKEINFTDRDELYVLGDVVDRGPHPMKVLQDMMMRSNVFPIIGNHDYVALMMLKKLNVEITIDNAETHLSDEDMLNYMHWIQNGGETTIKEFSQLNAEEREDILEYIEEEFSVYHKIICGSKRYILVHAGLNNFEDGKELDEYAPADLIFHRADYGRKYFKDSNTYLVTGHTPACYIREDNKPWVYEDNGHIAIDCGCVFGGQLAAFCIDNGKISYVKRAHSENDESIKI